MNSLLLVFFTVLLAASTSAFGGEDTRCPSGLPAQMFIDCTIAEGAAQCTQNGPGNVGAELYSVSDTLQAWIDLKMQRDVAHETAEPVSNDIAQQLDGH